MSSLRQMRESCSQAGHPGPRGGPAPPWEISCLPPWQGPGHLLQGDAARGIGPRSGSFVPALMLCLAKPPGVPKVCQVAATAAVEMCVFIIFLIMLNVKGTTLSEDRKPEVCVFS